MDDARRVRLRERLERLQHVVDDLGERQRPLHGEQLLEVAALEVLHDEEGRARGRGTDVDDAGDVLARDARGGLGLASEALDDRSELAASARRTLTATRCFENEVLGRVDDAHAALSGDLLEAVLAGDDIADLGHLVLGHAYRFSLTRASGNRAPNEGGQLGSIRVAPDENEGHCSAQSARFMHAIAFFHGCNHLESSPPCLMWERRPPRREAADVDPPRIAASFRVFQRGRRTQRALSVRHARTEDGS